MCHSAVFCGKEVDPNKGGQWDLTSNYYAPDSVYVDSVLCPVSADGKCPDFSTCADYTQKNKLRATSIKGSRYKQEMIPDSVDGHAFFFSVPAKGAYPKVDPYIATVNLSDAPSCQMCVEESYYIEAASASEVQDLAINHELTGMRNI